MIKHHPNTNMLAEFSAGTLASAQAIAVSAHLHHCSKCREQLRKLEAIGGILLDELTPTRVEDSEFQNLIDRIQEDQLTPVAVLENQPKPEDKELPLVINRLLSKQRRLKWKKLGPALSSAHLQVGQGDHQVSLHRIKAGAKTIEHDHQGDEITVVMKGSFSDENGLYQVGDFLHKQPGETHKPQASRHEDCLCLVVQAAPIAFTGLLSRWINPLLRIQAS